MTEGKQCVLGRQARSKDNRNRKASGGRRRFTKIFHLRTQGQKANYVGRFSKGRRRSKSLGARESGEPIRNGNKRKRNDGNGTAP